ncbi:DUF6531 domain-containing protein [Streptantibioticus parmotrematis]|uniref:DUF6531 domain-containing protein n=1 Tax=Streptantibioticus parmotrematis TaxID=2873249 RepID=UPI0033EF422B
MRAYAGNMESGTSGLSWCVTWDFNPNTPSGLTSGAGSGAVSITFYRASDHALLDGAQWAVYQSTGWCSLNVQLQAGVGYYATVRYGYNDGSSDQLTSATSVPVPVSGVPANGEPGCPGSMNSDGIVLDLIKYCGDPVNTATGAFGESVTDAQVRGPGFPFQLTRTYSSSSTASGVLGAGWSFPYSASLIIGQSVVTFVAEDGSQTDYALQSNGSLAPTRPYVHSSLRKTSSGYLLTAPDGHTLSFDTTGRLTSMFDAAGHGLSFAYTGNQLTSVTDAAGRKTTLAYSGSLLTTVTLPDGRTVTYGYTGGHLTSVKDLRGQTTSYGYATGSGLLTTITDPLGHTQVTNAYDGSGRVTSQANALGGKTTYSYDAKNPGTTYVTDPDGGIWTEVYAGGVISWQSDPYGKTTRYAYDSSLNRTSLTDPNGFTTTFTYDSAGNILTRTAPSSLDTESWTYDSHDNITAHKDGRGNTATYAYNGANQLTASTDPGGGTTKYTYNPLGALATVTTPRGKTTTYGYDSAGDRTSTTTPLGEKTTFGYDSAGRVTSKTDPRGNASGATASAYTTTYSYDSGDLLTSVTDPLGNTTAYGYDADGHLVSVKDPAGDTTTYGYDATGDLTSTKDPNGKTSTRGYDTTGNLTAATDPLGERTTYTYDKDNRELTTVTPRGNAIGATPAAYTTSYGYDADGNRTVVTDPTGAVTTTAYDAISRPVKVTDPLGDATATAYDADGNPTGVTRTAAPQILSGGSVMATGTTVASSSVRLTMQLDGNLVLYSYATGKPLWASGTYGHPGASATMQTDGNFVVYDTGKKALWASGTASTAGAGAYAKVQDDGNFVVYNSAASAKWASNTSGSANQPPTTSFTYDKANRRTSMTDPLGNATGYTYDADGNLLGQTTPAGDKATFTYNNDGREASATDPRGNASGATPAAYTTAFGYDAAGNRTTLTDPLGHTTTTAFDADDNTISVTDADQHTTSYAYDAVGRLSTVTAPDGGTTAYGYDSVGDLTSRTDADQHTTTYAYDDARRLTGVTDPLKRTRTYGYDPDGDPTTAVNARGTTATTSYDSRGLRTATAYSDGTTPKVTYGYDKDGRLTAASDATGGRVLAYDFADRLTSVSSGKSAFSYGYDATGDVLTRTYPDGEQLAYTYTADGKPASLKADGATTAYVYDAADNLITTALPATNGYTETRAYDTNGQVSSVADTNSTSTLASWKLTRDPAGLVTQVDTTRAGLGDGSQAFTYDAAGRLLTGCAASSTQIGCPSGSALTYTYDKVGNRLTQTAGSTTTAYSYDAADQLTQSSDGSTTTTYGYDDDGNTTSTTGPAGTTTAVYDAAGRLSQTTTGGATYAFTYDSDGNRVNAAKNGTLDRTTLWDVNNALPQPATETDGAGVLIGDYSYDPLGEPQSQHATSGTSFDHHDWLGSVTDVTSASGAQQSRTGYDPFGRSSTTSLTTGAATTPFGFTGQYNDPYQAGVQDLRAREYDTSTGRFTSTDPLAPRLTDPYVSAYVYADDRPTTLTDPSGMSPQGDDDPLTAIGEGLSEGAQFPFKFVGDIYDAFTGRNGGVGGFLNKYFPVRPDYELYQAAAKLRGLGCGTVADKVEAAADQLAQQIAVTGLAVWEGRAGAADDAVVTALRDEGIPVDAATGSGASPLPQGISEEEFTQAAELLRAGAGHYGDDIVVQGSRAAGTARPDSDIDFAIRVSPQRFDELIGERFGKPNPDSAKERTMLWAVRTGKIQAGEAGLSGLRRKLEAQLGMDVDLSIIRQGGPFDNPPFIGVPGRD